MSALFLYAHGGSGNHGCEAIVRTTAELLHEQDITLFSTRPQEDLRCGLSELCRVREEKQPCSKASPAFLSAYLALKLRRDYRPLDRLPFSKAAREVGRGDLALSIGGDNYCYADVMRYVMLHDIFRRRGAATILWGCSIEPSLLGRKELADDLASYSLITARETISYEALKRVNPNTILVSDSAFSLKPLFPALPEGFAVGNTVGINLSPMVLQNDREDGLTMRNYRKLIGEILQNTDMTIALIPHVIWEGNDDRQSLAELKAFFPQEERIVTIPDLGCRELKGVISQCRFFVGARTHATIAAYSSCVPTLVMGYSIKSRGIARDLFGNEEGYVLPIGSLQDEDALTEAFRALMKREDSVRKHLAEVLPAYTERALAGKTALGKL